MIVSSPVFGELVGTFVLIVLGNGVVAGALLNRSKAQNALGVLGSMFVVFLIEAVLIIAIGRSVFSVAIPNRIFSLLFVLALGAVAFAAMGLGITSLVRSAEGSDRIYGAKGRREARVSRSGHEA